MGRNDYKKFKERDIVIRNPDKDDISNYLKPKNKPRVDGTSLNMPCNCSGAELNPKIPRWQCEKCIESWVRSVDKDEAFKVADDFEQNGKKIAAARIRRVVKEIDYLKPIKG